MKRSLSIFRLSVRTGWRWQPSLQTQVLSCPRLQSDRFVLLVFLFSLSCDSLARNQDRTPTASPVIRDGDLSHGRDDFTTYLFRLFPALRSIQLVWWSAFLLDLGLILYFTTPMSWCVQEPMLLRADCSLCAALQQQPDLLLGEESEIAYLALVIGFGLTFSSLSLIYHDRKVPNSHLLGQEGIYCAPLSSSFSSPGSCGWSKSSCLVLNDHKVGLCKVFISLF